MDIMWLEDFIKLADEGNFSRAAEARNLTQPAFSRRIRALEDWVGATLVDRDTHRIALTEAGLAFRVLAEDIVRRLALGRDHVREIGGTLSNEIRFASTHALSTTFFPSWLRSLDNGKEAGTITLIADHMVACERFMLEGKADFLLCHHHAAASHRLDPAGFTSLHLGSDVLLPVTAPSPDGHPTHALPGSGEHPLPYLEFEERSGMGRILQAAQVISAGAAMLRPVFRSHRHPRCCRWRATGAGFAGRRSASLKTISRAAGSFLPATRIGMFRSRSVFTSRSRGAAPSVEAFWSMLKKRPEETAA